MAGATHVVHFHPGNVDGAIIDNLDQAGGDRNILLASYTSSIKNRPSPLTLFLEPTFGDILRNVAGSGLFTVPDALETSTAISHCVRRKRMVVMRSIVNWFHPKYAATNRLSRGFYWRRRGRISTVCLRHNCKQPGRNSDMSTKMCPFAQTALEFTQVTKT